MATIRSNSFDREILEELGRRLRDYRLQQNLTQHEVAAQAQLSPTTVKNAEAGRDPTLSTLVRLLRVLGRLEALDAFLPPPTVSPLQLLATAGKPRERARPRSTSRPGRRPARRVRGHGGGQDG